MTLVRYYSGSSPIISSKLRKRNGQIAERPLNALELLGAKLELIPLEEPDIGEAAKYLHDNKEEQWGKRRYTVPSNKFLGQKMLTNQSTQIKTFMT